MKRHRLAVSILGLSVVMAGCRPGPVPLPPPKGVACTTTRNGDSTVTEATAGAGAAVAHMTTTTAANQVSGHLTVSLTNQPILDLEYHGAAKGKVEIRETAGGHVWQFASADGGTFAGTLDGRALESLPTDKATDLIAQKGLHYADGAAVVIDPLPPATMTALQEVMAALKTNLATCPGSKQPSGSLGGSPGELRDPPPTAAHTESPGSEWPCLGCQYNCVNVFVGCILSVLTGATSCGIWAWACVAIGVTACVTVEIGCNIVCAVPGQPCCPVDCGWPSCCNYGHSCADPGAHSCCAVRCPASGNTCCNTGDTCFNDTLGNAQCCPAGLQICTGPQGSKCCGQGSSCNPVTGECCGPGKESCGKAGCCPLNTCNKDLNAPACCPEPDVPCTPCGDLGQRCCSESNPCPKAGGGAGCSLEGSCVKCPPPPAPKSYFEIDQTYGNNCGAKDDDFIFGGPCDPGFTHTQCDATPVPPFPSTIGRSKFTCEASLAHPQFPNDCTCVVHFHTPGDCFQHIQCHVKIMEQSSAPLPVGCAAAPPPVCHVGPQVVWSSRQVNGCGVNQTTGQCHTSTCWKVTGSCDSGTANGIVNSQITGSCQGQPMAIGPRRVDNSGGQATAYFDKPQDACYVSGCTGALSITFNVNCCQ